MLEAVADFILRHDLIRPGDRLLVALSGGADSVALLHLMAALRRRWDLELCAAHLDHGIRPDSSRDADWVAELCTGLGVPLVSERQDVPTLARERRTGLEAAGRAVRREFLRRVAASRGCRRIALGHHRGDQAETILHRLVRGTGPGGLAGMRPLSEPFIRPLLACSGAELRDWLGVRNLGWREDPSNRDPAFTRNRIRHQLLPRLREFNPRVEEALARLGRQLAAEEDFWEELVAETLAGISRFRESGLELDIAALQARHPALRARLLRAAAAAVRGDLRGIDANHVVVLQQLLDGERPQAEAHLPGLWAARRFEVLHLCRQAPQVPVPGPCALHAPGRLPLPAGGVLTVTLEEHGRGEDLWAVEFAADRIPWPLVVRPFAPGDRIRLAGGGRQKVKELLRAARISREARCLLPLVVADEILWIPGLRRAGGRRPRPGSPVLRLALEGAEPAARNNL